MQRPPAPADVSGPFAEAEAHREAGRTREAAELYGAVLKDWPDHAPSIHGMAQLALARGNLASALEFSLIAIGFGPPAAHYHLTAARALERLDRLPEGADQCDAALRLEPHNPEAHDLRGVCLWRIGRYQEAARAFDKALAFDPGLANRQHGRIFDRLLACDWSQYELMRERAATAVRTGRGELDSFVHAVIAESPADQLLASRAWAERLHPARPALWNGEGYGHDRLRVAYVSGDFRGHAVSFMSAGMFEGFDRSRFEFIGVALGPPSTHAIRERVMAGLDRFLDVGEAQDEEVARTLRAMEIDIAVDFSGNTNHGRPGIFAHRPAPIQVSHLGFPATLGTAFHDYIVADRQLIPPGEEAFYSEKVVRLPDTYFPTDCRMAISPGTPSRAEAGLPQEVFVFCAFNKSYKLSPQMFGAWMRILRQVEDSVLWLTDGGEAVQANLRREAKARGVDAARLIFAPRTPLREDHLARQRCADLYLDNLPYGGHTTMVDALFAGLPALTCRGPTFVGRVGASLLSAVGMPELIAPTLAEYEVTAVGLARDPARLAALRQRMEGARATAPLFDTARWCRNMEAAFLQMHARLCEGLPPEGFDVP